MNLHPAGGLHPADTVEMESALEYLLEETASLAAYHSRNVVVINDYHDCRAEVYTKITSRLAHILGQEKGEPGRCDVCLRFVYDLKRHMATKHVEACDAQR